MLLNVEHNFRSSSCHEFRGQRYTGTSIFWHTMTHQYECECNLQALMKQPGYTISKEPWNQNISNEYNHPNMFHTNPNRLSQLSEGWPNHCPGNMEAACWCWKVAPCIWMKGFERPLGQRWTGHGASWLDSNCMAMASIYIYIWYIYIYTHGCYTTLYHVMLPSNGYIADCISLAKPVWHNSLPTESGVGMPTYHPIVSIQLLHVAGHLGIK